MKKKEKPNCDFINCKYIILTLLPEQNQREKQKKTQQEKPKKTFTSFKNKYVRLYWIYL